MKPQEIDRLLATYRKNRARAEHLAIEISRMEAELGNQEKTAILHDALRAQTYGTVRKSSSAKKPVEDLVLQYLDGYKPPLIHQWREELESMKKEQQERKQAMRYVEVWIGALTGREQKVVLAVQQPFAAELRHRRAGDGGQRDGGPHGPQAQRVARLDRPAA